MTEEYLCEMDKTLSEQKNRIAKLEAEVKRRGECMELIWKFANEPKYPEYVWSGHRDWFDANGKVKQEED